MSMIAYLRQIHDKGNLVSIMIVFLTIILIAYVTYNSAAVQVYWYIAV